MRGIPLAAVTVMALAIGSTASAQGYVGASVGQSRVSVDCTGTLTCDKEDVGVKVFGGYMFTPNLGVELSYADLGKAAASADFFGSVVNIDIKGSAFAAYGVAAWPFNDSVRVFGKAGLASFKTKVEGGTGGVLASDSKTTTDFAWGLGGEYQFAKQFSVRLEWDRYRAKYADEKWDVDLWSIGARYNF